MSIALIASQIKSTVADTSQCRWIEMQRRSAAVIQGVHRIPLNYPESLKHLLMVPVLIEQADQRCQQRLRDAFAAFSVGDGPQKTLELDNLDQLPPPDRIRLPYADGQFDWVACFSLLEHYSNHERQVRFLRELLRVARRGVFVATPNGAHPLARWLNPEHELVLLDAMDIKALVDVLPGRPEWRLGHVRLYGFKAYYFLMIWKPGFTSVVLSQ